LDGLANGACTLDVAPCLDARTIFLCSEAPEARAAVTPLDAPGATALQAALDSLIAEGGSATRCRSVPVAVPVGRRRHRNLGITFHVVAETSLPYYRSEQAIDLYCLPAGEAPSFSGEIAPILVLRCAVAGCHTPTHRRGGLDLSSSAVAYDAFLRDKVFPDRPRRSHLLTTIRARRMPPGCRGRRRVPPPGGCLSPEERKRIVAWILGGGPDN
jgi:hypothetical protein